MSQWEYPNDVSGHCQWLQHQGLLSGRSGPDSRGFKNTFKGLGPKFTNGQGDNLKSLSVYIEAFRITKEKKRYNDLQVIL